MALTQYTRHNTAGAMHLAQGNWQDALWHNALLAQCTWHKARGAMHLAQCTPGTLHLAQSACAMHLALYCSWHTQHNALGTMPFGTMPSCTMHLAQCTPGTMHLAQSTWTWHALGTMHLSAIHLEQCSWHNALGTMHLAHGTMHLAQCTWHSARSTTDLAQWTWRNTLGTTMRLLP